MNKLGKKMSENKEVLVGVSRVLKIYIEINVHRLKLLD